MCDCKWVSLFNAQQTPDTAPQVESTGVDFCPANCTSRCPYEILKQSWLPKNRVLDTRLRPQHQRHITEMDSAPPASVGLVLPSIRAPVPASYRFISKCHAHVGRRPLLCSSSVRLATYSIQSTGASHPAPQPAPARALASPGSLRAASVHHYAAAASIGALGSRCCPSSAGPSAPP